MIQAEQIGEGVHINIGGEKDEVKNELITIFIKSMELFTEEEIFQMLAAAEGLIDADDVMSVPDGSDNAVN